MADAVVPPQNLEAEESVLGAMLVAPTTIPAVLGEQQLKPEHFYRDRHREIYRAILALHERQAPVDVLSVCEELATRRKLDRLSEQNVDGRDIVASMAAKVPAPGSALHYAEIVVKNARLRHIDSAAKRIQQSIAERDEVGIADARALLDQDVVQDRKHLDPDTLRDIAYSMAEGDPRPLYPWPFERLNYIAGQGHTEAGGIRPGQLAVISAHTHFGKTAFTHQCLDSFAKAGADCEFMFNEMDAEEHIAGVVQRHTKVPAPQLTSGRLDAGMRSDMVKALNDPTLFRWPMTPIHGWNAREVCAEIRLRRRDVVAVDILHNFVLADNANAERELSDIVSQFYEAAKVSQTAILLTAHVNRNRIQAGVRPRPTKGDLRGTGDIENKADIVCFVHRAQHRETFQPLPYDDDEGADGFNSIYFDKYRGGWLGGIGGGEHPLRFNEERIRFEPVIRAGAGLAAVA